MIDEDGTSLGQIDNWKAQQIASEKGLDLVEINPSSRPPVCKIMDSGKYKYDLAKKDKEQRSKQKDSELKEIRLTLKIGDHDLSYKAKNALEEKTTTVQKYDDFEKTLKNKGGFIKAPWCGSSKCEEKIKEETGATIRLRPFEKEKPIANCVYCGEKAVEMVYFARSY